MNGYLTNDFNKTGRAGIMIDIGKGKGLGASRVINLHHNNRDRNLGNKDNSNINRGQRYSDIGNRDRSNNLRLSSLNDSSRRDRRKKDNLRLGSPSRSSRRDRRKKDNLRLSSPSHSSRRDRRNKENLRSSSLNDSRTDKSKGLRSRNLNENLSKELPVLDHHADIDSVCEVVVSFKISEKMSCQLREGSIGQ